MIRYLLLLTIFASAVAQACDRPVDPKKIVIYMGFHGGGAEIDGAIAGACKRGETLVAFPPVEDMREDARLNAAIQALERASMPANAALSACYRQCNGRNNCDSRCSTQIAASNVWNKKIDEAYKRRSEWRTARGFNGDEGDASGMKSMLEAKIAEMKASGAKLSALILSGHDGGGHIYGDFGQITKEELFNIARRYPAEMSTMHTLMLMGCWTAVPEQVDQWKTVFPGLKVIGGFVGSAPAVTRLGSQTYIEDLLAKESQLRAANSQQSVSTILSGIRNLNIITSGVYVDLNKSRCSSVIGNNQDFYYVSPANNEKEVNIPPGVHPYEPTTGDAAQLRCLTEFNAEMDWSTVDKYWSGEKEPDDTPELRGLYSKARNNEHCYSVRGIRGHKTPDQILFLRFFQGVKKNFNKYYGPVVDKAYAEIDAWMKTHPKSDKTAYVYDHYAKMHLRGDAFLKLDRKTTLEEISRLQGLQSEIMWSSEKEKPSLPNLDAVLKAANLHLYQLQCLDPRWHEYEEGATLPAPTCDRAPQVQD